MSRLRYNFITGLCSLTGSTLTLASGINVTVNSGNYLPIAINPAPYTSVTQSISTEIVWVTAYTAGSTTATVSRGQEGTSALSSTIWPTGTPYAHGSTTQDFGLLNQLQNNDFPNPTASGQILVSIAAGSGSLPTWDTISTTISGYYPGLVVSGYYSTLTVSGSQVYGDLSTNATISGTKVYGALTNATISGSQIVGLVTAISGYYPSLVVSGSEVYGALTNATIPSGNVTGANYLPVNGTANQLLTWSGSGAAWTSQVNIPNNTSVAGLIETGIFVNAGAIGTISLNLQKSSLWYYTVAASGNFTLNLTGSGGGGTINNILTSGQSITAVFLNTTGTNIYYANIIQIDGSPVTPLWQGTVAPTVGVSTNGVDSYSFAVLKTSNSPTYTVLASLTGF